MKPKKADRLAMPGLYLAAARVHRVSHGDDPYVAVGQTHVRSPGADAALCGFPTPDWSSLWHIPVTQETLPLLATTCEACVAKAAEQLRRKP